MDEEKNSNEEFGADILDLKNKCEEYLNGWKRAKADFINYQKDEARRATLFLQFSNEAIIKDLITILDSFDLALTVIQNNDNLKGFQLIYLQLEDLLKKHGLEKLKISIGDQFDPNFQEAVAEVESSSSTGSGQVAEILENGYTLHGKLLRAAKVKVVK